MFLYTGCENCKKEWAKCCGSEFTEEEIKMIKEEVKKIMDRFKHKPA